MSRPVDSSRRRETGLESHPVAALSQPVREATGPLHRLKLESAATANRLWSANKFGRQIIPRTLRRGP
jgi:hypothetical protein